MSISLNPLLEELQFFGYIRAAVSNRSGMQATYVILKLLIAILREIKRNG